MAATEHHHHNLYLLYSTLLYSSRPQSKVLSRTRNPHAVCDNQLVFMEPAAAGSLKQSQLSLKFGQNREK
jgi:hypothetical protein